METKEMTQQEIFAYLNDTKILCTSREESKNVQEKLFALGFCYYGEKSNEVVDSAFTLYINFHNKMQFGSDLSIWVDNGARRIEPNEILAIQLKEEKPKFYLSKEEIEKYQQISIELRVKEFTALVYKDGLEAVTKEVKEVIEKWLTPIVKCKEVIATQEDRGYNILLIFEDYSAKISLYELTILEAQNLTKEYLVKNYGIRTTL